MIKQFLDSLEDPDKPLFGPNYWILKKIGLILPESKLGKFLYIVLHEIVSFFVFTQYIELYVIRSDLDLVLTNLKISMLSVVCIVKSNTFVFWQKHWKDVINYLTEADKYERQSSDPTRNAILGKYTKYCRQMTYYYWILVFTTVLTTTGTPLMRYLSSVTFREHLHNGTELFPHIFSSWMPFDKYHSPGSWITVVWHALLCIYGGTIMAAYDTNAMVIMVFFGGKLELLRVRCKQMLDDIGDNDVAFDKRIRELHQTYVLVLRSCKEKLVVIKILCNPVQVDGTLISDSTYNFYLISYAIGAYNTATHIVSIRDSLIRYCPILLYSRLFNSVLSPVMFFYMVNAGLMLCASAYQLTSAQNAAQKLLMAEYLIFGIAQLFIFCWHSNDVLLKHEDVILGPYESQWWSASLKRKKSILLLAGQLRIKQIFTAGPFTNLTLSTFINILKGAYSYYTLLRK